ncbi:MAG: Crp/Fnr family transcriptional regulator [Chitinophagales bacterium]
MNTNTASRTNHTLGITGITFERLLRFLPLKQQQKALKTKQFRKGEYIYHPYKNGNKIYLVKSGRVKVSKRSEDGREFIQNVAWTGDLFGELSLIMPFNMGEYAQALEDTAICQIPIEAMQELMKDNWLMQLQLMELFAKRLQQTEQLVHSQIQGDDAYIRIRQWLQSIAEQKGEEVNSSIVAIPRFSPAEIGAIVGTSVQTVRNVLKQLKQERFLKIERNQIFIENQSKNIHRTPNFKALSAIG